MAGQTLVTVWVTSTTDGLDHAVDEEPIGDGHLAADLVSVCRELLVPVPAGQPVGRKCARCVTLVVTREPLRTFTEVSAVREGDGAAVALAGMGTADLVTRVLVDRVFRNGPVFVARLKRSLLGADYNGHPLGERDIVAHIFPVPVGAAMPGVLVAVCGFPLLPGVGELVPRMTGQPCDECVVSCS
jgi:hypothetical protein